MITTVFGYYDFVFYICLLKIESFTVLNRIKKDIFVKLSFYPCYAIFPWLSYLMINTKCECEIPRGAKAVSLPALIRSGCPGPHEGLELADHLLSGNESHLFLAVLK
jgi:hypothetical protein